MAKRTEEAAKLAGLVARKTGAPMEGTESGDLVAVNNALQRHKMSNDHDSFDHVWSGINEFLQNLKVAGLMPIGETADIGTALRMFRKLWVSELTTLIFRKGNVLVMDGMFVLTKQSGKFAADVAAGDTQIDFGQALTVGDYLLLRAENKMEYMQVGTLVDGTTYNVTRNLDGSGANDWPRESVYFVRGHEGDGWLELTAVDEQRISSFTQGANWDQWLEDIRLGIIDGWQASPFSGNGFAMGDYAAGKYMIYTDNDGFLINGSRAQFGNMVADENGLSLMRLRDAIRFYKDGKIIGKLLSNSAGEEDFIRLQFGEEDSDFFIDGKFSQDPSLWSGHSLMFDDNDYISAPRALKLHSGLFNNPSHYVESPFISVSANKVYQVSYWDKFISGGLSSNGLGVMIHCDCYDANNQPISSGGFTSSAGYYGYNPKSYDWRQTSHTFKTPANTAKIVITITCWNGDSNNYSQLLFDDFEIVELFGLSQIDIYKNKVEISSDNGLLVNGNVAATNISQSPIENGILQAGADKKISSGWLPDLSSLYLPINGKAADAEKLDGKDSSDYALVGHKHPFDCCKVRRKGGQTIANSTWTAISWTGEDFDTNNMWSSGSEITIKTSGYYHIEIYVELGKNTVGQRCAYLKINSNIITRVNLMPMNTTTFPTTAMISWEGTLALNDKVSAFVWQNSGVNLSVSATYNSTMTVRQVVGN